MKKPSIIFLFTIALGLIVFTQCTEKKKASGENRVEAMPDDKTDYHGFETQIAWGEHLVIIGGCNDCHTPKKMSDRGPVLDYDLMLSGHPAGNPPIDIDRKEIESKGLAVTSDLTEWIGPWGISYAANLTPHGTGTGNWTEEQFIYALRHGKIKGLPDSRPFLPPMPWEMYRNMTDDELKAVFAYLKSIKPIDNLVPPPVPPASADR
jgi:hypothetical protein